MKQYIDTLYKEWLSLQPLKREDQQRLDRKFMLEFNYNSNHIEGNTLTYGQTELLLMFGDVNGSAKMSDLEEMKAHNVALNMVKEEAKSKERPLTQEFIRTLHKTLVREDYTIQRQQDNGLITASTILAGKYKEVPNSVRTVTGEIFEYASPEETPILMRDLVDWYNAEEEKAELTPIELASIFHYRYIRIHPFGDGNGRIARLMVNYILLRHQYPMIIVESRNKGNYLHVLHRCDISVGSIPAEGARAEYKPLKPFIEYMEECLKRALTICIKAAKGENINEEDDFAKQIALLKRSTKKEERELALEETVETKANVFNKFHRELAQRILNKVDCIKSFYEDVSITYYFGYQNPFSKITSKLELSVDKTIDVNSEYIKRNINISNLIYFFVYMDKAVPEYKIKGHPIRIAANVEFFKDHYSFNDKEYKYNCLPSKEEINTFIVQTESMILREIKGNLE